MSLQEALSHLFNKSAKVIPFTDSWNVRRRLKGSTSILDVGCGEGETMIDIKRDCHFIKLSVGVDIHRPYLESCKRKTSHDHILLADVRHLPFKTKSLDSVICLEVLEHLEKNEGYAFLQSLERIAKKGVIIATPVGRYGQRPYDNNVFQEHKSQWHPLEMQRLGYSVTVSSMRGIGGEWRGRKGFYKILDLVYRITSVLVIPVVSLVPQIAGHMVCYKQINKFK